MGETSSACKKSSKKEDFEKIFMEKTVVFRGLFLRSSSNTRILRYIFFKNKVISRYYVRGRPMVLLKEDSKILKLLFEKKTSLMSLSKKEY